MQANKILLLISLALFTHSKILVMDMEDLRKLSADGDLRNLISNTEDRSLGNRSLISDTEDRSLTERRLGYYQGTCWARNGKIYEGKIDMETSRVFLLEDHNVLSPARGRGVWVQCTKYRLG